MTTEHQNFRSSSLSDSMSSLDSLTDGFYERLSTLDEPRPVEAAQGVISPPQSKRTEEDTLSSNGPQKEGGVSLKEKSEPGSECNEKPSDDNVRPFVKEESEWVLRDDESQLEFEKVNSDSEDAESIGRTSFNEELSNGTQLYEEAPISMCGKLNITLQYFLSKEEIIISILEAKELPIVNKGGAQSVEVHVLVLPYRKKRFKTKPCGIDCLQFSKKFKVSGVPPIKLATLGFRFRVYAVNKQAEAALDAEKKSSRKSSIAAMSYGGALPEILLSLSYEKETGKLHLRVEKASHLHDLASSKPPDTFVQFSLLNASYQEMARSQTSIRRSQPSPTFKESFYFQVAQSQLKEVTLLVSVYKKRTFDRKLQIGWISLGASSSGESEQQHWNEMTQTGKEPVSKWHNLLSP